MNEFVPHQPLSDEANINTPRKSRKELTSERIEEESNVAIAQTAGVLRLKDPAGRKGSSINPNKNFMWDVVDDSVGNAVPHEEALAILEGWRPPRWKGMVWRGIVGQDRVWTGLRWIRAKAIPEVISIPPVYASPLTRSGEALQAAIKSDRGSRIATNELNAAYEAFAANPLDKKEELYVTLYASARSRRRVRECSGWLTSLVEVEKEIDDIFSDFALDLIKRMEKGQYVHEGKLHIWMDYIWNSWFFPDVQTKILKYLNHTHFVNSLDPEDTGFEFQNHSVALSSVNDEQVERGREGCASTISVDRVLQELDNPASSFFQLSKSAKTMLREMADGLNQKEVAVKMNCSAKTISRWMGDVRVAGQEMLNSGALPTVQGCTGQGKLLQWPIDEDYILSISACAATANVYLSPKEAAAYLGGLNARTLTRWAREEYLPAIPIGEGRRRLWRFIQDDLDGWMLARRQGGQNAA